MAYTVKQLAKLAHITPRTLHFYDEMGLLKPSYTQSNGYRVYEEKELLRLQQIMFFRELELPLEEIKKIIDAPGFNIVEALKSHKKLIELKQKRLTGLLETITKTIKKMSKETTMKDGDLYEGFDDAQMKEYQKEAKERWGNTEAWKQSQERVKKMGKAGTEKVGKEMQSITVAIGKNMSEGIESKIIQDLVKKHHEAIGNFYDSSYEMYKNLGEMYVADPRFTSYYEKIQPGLAVFMRDAIKYYCARMSI
jgi:DNA-binding transcriptional MerR regulator